MTASQGSQWQSAFDSTAVDSLSIPMEVVSCSLVANYEIVESNGIRGTRSRTKERVRRGLIRCGGNIVMHFSPTEIDTLLPSIMGGTEVANVFPLAETVPSFAWMVDTGAKVYEFSGCKVDRAIWRSSPGQPLELEMDVLAQTVTQTNAGTFPSLTFDTDTMYVHSDAVFTYNSVAYEILNAELTLDNSLNARFGNSTTATSIDAQDRRVTLAVETPWVASDGSGSNDTTLYETTVGGNAGTLVYTNSAQSITFALANMQISPASTPILQGRQEITKRLTYNCYKSATTNELIITNVP